MMKEEFKIMAIKNYFLVTVYTPNSKRDLSRLDYRQKSGIEIFNLFKRIRKKLNQLFFVEI